MSTGRRALNAALLELKRYKPPQYRVFPPGLPRLFSLETLLPDVPPAVLGWVSALSALTFIGSLIAVPIIVTRIRADYFEDPYRHEPGLQRGHPAVYVTVRVLKNLLAVILVAGGVLMLVLPGQGLLTILIGVGVSDFPGKFRLERRLVALPGILAGINWIRRKAHVEPLRPPVEL